MKKLIALVLVLGLASLANAGTVSITGPAEIVCGTSETYTVVYTGTPDIVAFDIDVCPSGECPATISTGGVTIIAANRNPDYDYVGPGYYCPDDGIEVGAGSDAAALGTTWFTFTLTAAADPPCEYCQYVTLTPGYVFIMDTDWQEYVPDFASLEVHCIPEPASMLLIGLGGLLLRRRK